MMKRESTPSHAIQSEMIFSRWIRYKRGVCQDLQAVKIDGIKSICNVSLPRKGH
jgi:hypothetical protein